MSVSSASHNGSPHMYQAATPADIVSGHNYPTMASTTPPPAGASEARNSSESGVSSLKSPRTPRFAEATSVQSPIGATETGRSPFADPPKSQTPPDVSDVGFGYVAANDPAQHASHFHPPPASPLKSAMKVPGTPGRALNPLSPTFREEFYVEKQERDAGKDNAKDLRIKLRVRIAKIFLRFVNFGCSLIVLAILGTTLNVFLTTKSLPARNNLPAWAEGTNPWPQYLLLSISCVSLFACLIVFWGYWKGGHKRAEKVAIYYSIISVGFFVFSLIMWIVGAAIYEHSKANGNSKDLWGWSCNQNTREKLFNNDIDYALVCRLQDWGLDWGLVCAIIEVVIEVLVILIYAVVFYRFYTKRRLIKTMNRRDKARSDLYLAQLRFQSAPNTPGLPQTPKTPFISTSQPHDPYSAAENGEMYSTQYATPQSPAKPQPSFQLQPPPIRVQHPTPKQEQEGFPAPPPPAHTEANQHVGAAPGERTYDAVPIPIAYASPMSPSFPPGTHH